jgi:hypothetical protein
MDHLTITAPTQLPIRLYGGESPQMTVLALRSSQLLPSKILPV